MKYLHCLESQKILVLAYVVCLLISGHVPHGNMANSLMVEQPLRLAVTMTP